MTDSFGREITYMRVSVTDRCNLRCRYCMPLGAQPTGPQSTLSFHELLRLCGQAVALGIHTFKITGGEPLMRPGCVPFIAALRTMPGVRQVTLTTNGLLLERHLPALLEAGIDGINISLDTSDSARYCSLTGHPAPAPDLVALARRCAGLGIPTKLNAVLLQETAGDILALAALAADSPLDVRFIELMPMGPGRTMEGLPMEAALALLRARWPDCHPTAEKRGNGPAQYYTASGLMGYIGFIPALSGSFCIHCNRVRLTATGSLRPCLCFDAGIGLRGMLRRGASDAALQAAMAVCIAAKPASHCFAQPECAAQAYAMNRIGG